MDLVDVMLIAGGCRDMETLENIIETMLFIEEDNHAEHATQPAESDDTAP